MRIGVAGTGRMGTAIVRRLLQLGHRVQVWNRTADNARDARAAGAEWSATPACLVEASDVVICFLFNDTAADQVFLGANGLLTGPVRGRLFIDMSTLSPGAHARIASDLAAREAGFIECPVSGSIPAAQSGKLVGFAGGSTIDFRRAQPLLEQLCRRVEHVGALGAGARLKLAANLLLAVLWQTLGESLLLAGGSAVDAERTIDLLADSNIGAAILRSRASEIVAALKEGAPGEAAFDVDTVRKDLSYMVREAAGHSYSLPLATKTLECFDLASQEGRGKMDSVAYPAYWISRNETLANAAAPARGKKHCP